MKKLYSLSLLALALLVAAGATVAQLGPVPSGAMLAQLRPKDKDRGPAHPRACSDNAFGIGCWLPYWKKKEGAAALLRHLELFEQFSPFCFRVREDGTLRDMARMDQAPWPGLLRAAGERGTAVIPTLVWFKSRERAAVLGDPARREAHVGWIAELAQRHGFSGVDIDYERKTVAEREDFSRFLTALSGRLHEQDRRLSCTIEPRTSDQPPGGVSGQRASPWANDYRVLARVCDQVRIMAYDRWSIDAAAREGQHSRAPSHAGLEWVEAVVRYSVSRIDPGKLYLGIPTYGWEFEEQKRKGQLVYRRVRARSFSDIAGRIGKRSVGSERGPGGELHLRDGNKLVVMPDARAIEERIDLARRHGLRGVVLFKMDGQEDPGMWRVLRESIADPKR